MPNAPKILIAYESRHGHTAEIAARLAEDVGARGAEATVLDVRDVPRDFTIEPFDAVVVGAPVYFGRHLSEAAGFVRRHRDALEERVGGLFSVSGHAADETPEGDAETRACVDAFVEATGWRPDRVARFAGAVTYTRYNVLLRWVMKRIQRKAGRSTDTSTDHVYTDWDAVEDFAREIVQGATERAKTESQTA